MRPDADAITEQRAEGRGALAGGGRDDAVGLELLRHLGIDDAPRKPVPPVTVDTSCCRYPDAMRTTVAIDDALLVAAKLGARRRQL